MGIFKGVGESVVAAKCPQYTPAIAHLHLLLMFLLILYFCVFVSFVIV